MSQMKNLLMVCMLAVSAMSINAQARSIKAFDLFTLDKVQLDNQLTRFEASFGTGKIDYIRNSISLTIPLTITCAPGIRCPRLMPAPLKITLPIVSSYLNSCHAMVYVAKSTHGIEVDGVSEDLEFVDNSSNNCKYFVAIPQIEITYKTQRYDRFDHRLIKTHSEMSGQKN